MNSNCKEMESDEKLPAKSTQLFLSLVSGIAHYTGKFGDRVFHWALVHRNYIYFLSFVIDPDPVQPHKVICQCDFKDNVTVNSQVLIGTTSYGSKKIQATVNAMLENFPTETVFWDCHNLFDQIALELTESPISEHVLNFTKDLPKGFLFRIFLDRYSHGALAHQNRKAQKLSLADSWFINILLYSKEHCDDPVINKRKNLCLDFEATCWKDAKEHEIIEFPSVVIDVKNGKIIDSIEQFVKPKRNVELSDFCKNLTSITQDQVNNGVCLKEALSTHFRFINSKYPSSIAVTCGDWDLKTMLPTDACFNGLTISNWYKKWINLKIPFQKLYELKKPSMSSMIGTLGMIFEGTEHRGIDDSRNLARICLRMLEDGWIPEITGCVVN